MKAHARSLIFSAAALLAVPLAAVSISLGPTPEEAPFIAENDVAMQKMMAGMDVRPTGDVDRDFVAMMVPHHQGAIDMAQALLRHGRNEHLRRLAQEIIVTQQEEIAAMRLAVGEPLRGSARASTETPPAAAARADSHAIHRHAEVPE